jgi:hypothetical protein
MKVRLYILAASLLLWAQPAAAANNLSIALDLSVAPTLDPGTAENDACPPNPYVLARRGCVNDLNFAGGRTDSPRLSSLDQLLLLANRLKDLNLDRDIRPNTQLKFTFGLVNLYEQEAKARLALRIRF